MLFACYILWSLGYSASVCSVVYIRIYYNLFVHLHKCSFYEYMESTTLKDFCFCFFFFLANLMKKDFVGQRGAKIWMCGNFNPLFFVFFFSLFLSHRRPTSQQSIDFIYVFIFIHTCIWVTRDLTFFLKEHWVNTCIFLLLFYFLICNCDIIFCWNYWHSSQYLGLS